MGLVNGGNIMVQLCSGAPVVSQKADTVHGV